MSFLKNVFNILTDKREITEPVVYKEFNDKSNLVTNLTRLAEIKNPNVDIKKVESHLKLFSIGQAGEKNVLYELQNSMLPFIVLHDVYVEFESYNAQLDFIIITHKFIMVLEVKKLFGDIHVTDKGEFQRVIRKNNRVVNKEGMYSPINQVERHVAILEKLLKDKGVIERCPIKYSVTFANPKTILDISKNAPANIQSSVIRHDQIKVFIKNELEKKSPVFMLDHQVYEIANTILKYSKEKPFNIEDYTLDLPQKSHNDLTSDTANESRGNTNTNTNTNTNNDAVLKTSLTDFRLRRSRELKVKPYYIFTNKILDCLLEKRPLTLNQLLEIEGFGHKKVEEFGEDILFIIKDNYPEDNLPVSQSTGDSKDKDTSTKMESKVPSKSGNLTVEEIRLALTAFRTSRSKEINVKPYYIFNNNTLEAILEKKPGSINELLRIEGFGPKKAEEFGQEILDIILNSNKL
ncbi:helicase [Anaerobacillus alkaliphilus]|uniref:Helicase n=1 Tax=Anaerobacillus alkaliphilus TaxID=1548597 RepID=A0A4Q0VU52_9BACI|nr:HRDC domain-containing protein [Anaerobacillus alkaliphilus]RXJ02207.1 helicase [Anaerobacillus alkaliphilus]